MNQVTTSSFQNSPDQIERAPIIHQLKNDRNVVNSVKPGQSGSACAWSADGLYYAWSSGLRTLHIVPTDQIVAKSKKNTSNKSVGEEQPHHNIDCGERIWTIAFGTGQPLKESLIFRKCCPDKNLLVAVGLASGGIKVFNCFTGFVVVKLLDHKDTVRGLDFSKDGSLQLLSGARDGTLKLWDLNNEGNMFYSCKVRTKVNSCKYSPNGKFISAVGTNRMVLLWRGQIDERSMQKLTGHVNEVVSVDFSPDSAFMATASFDTRVIVWSTHTGNKIKTLGHLYPSPSLIFAGGANMNYVRSVCFSRDGVNLGTVCDDGYLRIWEWENDCDPISSILEVNEPLTCRFSPDGSVLSVGTRTGQAIFVSTPNPVSKLMHLSRLSVRKAMKSDKSDDLPIPNLLKDFVFEIAKEG